jgi:polar amino acid transport system substrate-binding protein
MRKYPIYWTILLTAAGLGCGGGGDAAPAPALQSLPAPAAPPCTPAAPFQPVSAATLTVVTSLPGPGFWEGSDEDPSAVSSGFEYDVAQELRARLCLERLVVRNESFDGIVSGAVTGFDLALSQISITPERAQAVDFTQPYFQSLQGVLVKKGKQIKTLDDVKAARWGVQAGTTAIELLAGLGLAERTSVYPQLPDAYTALDAEQIDAVLVDTAINLGQAARSQGRFEVVAQMEQPSGPDRYGALLPRGSANLPAVDAVLKELKDSGRLAELAKKDLTADPGNIPVIPTGG